MIAGAVWFPPINGLTLLLVAAWLLWALVRGTRERGDQ